MHVDEPQQSGAPSVPVPAMPVYSPTVHPELQQLLQQAAATTVPGDDMDIDSAVVHEVYELISKNKEGRGSKELNAKKFDEAERKRYEASDRKELGAWKEKDTMVQLPREDSDKVAKQCPGRIIPGRARVVRTSKKDPGQKTPVAKSRIVVPGHKDQDLGEFRSDSPTAPQVSLYFLMVIAAGYGWDLSSFDVEIAFLIGEKLLR